MAGMIRAMLGDEFDGQTFQDTLEGESDVMEVLGYLIRDRGEAKANAAACADLAKTYAARAARLNARAAAN